MLSVLLAVRDWEGERIEACVASFERLPAETVSDIVVLDYGSAVPVQLSQSFSRARVVRIEAERWSLAEATNAAVLAAKNDIVAKTDADILVTTESAAGIARAVARIASGEYDLHLVQVEDLDEDVSVADAAAAIAAGRRLPSLPRPRWGQGGFTMFSRQMWASIGGYDSRYVGYGNEDNDFCDRVRRAGHRLGWVPQEDIALFHIWHPPTYQQTHVARDREANRRRLEQDRTVFRPLRFLHSDPTPIVSPAIIRSTYPLVSVAIATASRPARDRMIGETISSFRDQIDGDFEIVVMDNGSDDQAFGSLKAGLDKHPLHSQIRLERAPVASIPIARNEIARIARGKFICVVDDDDLALKNRLADHLKCFDRDGLAHGSHGGWIDFDEESGLIEKNTGKPRTIATMLKGAGKVTSHPSSFYRTDVMRALPYDESLKLGSDWDLALRAAAMGLRFTHTQSYVTLRRFHTSNVTLTGSSNQVSTGLKSRTRSWALYSARQQAALLAEVRENDAYLPCNNDMSILDLLHLLPDYAGVWRITMPFALLGQPAPGNPNATLLESVLDIVDGDLITGGPGIDMPVLFCSEPVRGCRRAREIVDKMTRLAGQSPSIVSDRQLSLDRSLRFDWDDIVVPEDGAMVISERIEDVNRAVEVVSSISPSSLLRVATRIVSDSDDTGPAFYLMTPPTDSRVDAQQMIYELNITTGLKFKFARRPDAPALPTSATDRFH